MDDTAKAKFNQATEEIVRQYPFLDSTRADADQNAIQEVVRVRDTQIQAGHEASDALWIAAHQIAQKRMARAPQKKMSTTARCVLTVAWVLVALLIWGAWDIIRADVLAVVLPQHYASDDDAQAVAMKYAAIITVVKYAIMFAPLFFIWGGGSKPKS